MASSGGEPEKKKRPARRTQVAGGGRKGPSGRKNRGKQDEGIVPGPRRRIPSAPLLVAWVMAIVVLGGLIYLGHSGHRHGMPASTSATVSDQHTTKGSKPVGTGFEPKSPPAAGAHSGRSAPPVEDGVLPPDRGHGASLPSGPVIPQKRSFSSSDIPPEPGGDALAVALHKPSVPPPPRVPLVPTKPSLARAAIIIDDFGQDIEIARKFLGLPFQVTFSVLPFLHHSRDIAEAVHSHGREVILHCPMEPLGYPKVDPGSGAILMSMSEETMRQTLRSALDSSPYFSGVNNHMGSRITENTEAMKTILGEVHRRGLYFVDSCTTSRSVGWSVALQLKMPCGKRSVFLDHSAAPAAIRSQITRFIRAARVEGSVIAIGHPRESTLKALREAAGEFQAEGIQIVPAREIVGGR